MLRSFVDHEVVKVKIDNKEFLGSFANFFDRGVILFTGKISFLWRVKQRLHGALAAHCVQEVYANSHGFCEVLLVS